MLLIEIGLAIAALYSGGAYLWVFYRASRPAVSRFDFNDARDDTFRLGLCFIGAIGFLGLLLK